MDDNRNNGAPAASQPFKLPMSILPRQNAKTQDAGLTALEYSDRRPNEAVEPIKDPEDILRAKEWFLAQTPRWRSHPTNLRNYMMFVININNATRISDLLQLRIEDVIRSDGSFRDQLYIREQKTDKTRFMFFGEGSKEAIYNYLTALDHFEMSDFLIQSRNRDADGRSKPITRQMAWIIISTMGKEISKDRKMPLHLGTHSMRKTFGYQRIAANPNDAMVVAQVSEMYNHSSMNTTYRYLGFDVDSKRGLCIHNEL